MKTYCQQKRVVRAYNTPRSDCNFSRHGGIPPIFPERHAHIGVVLSKEAGADCLYDNIVVRVDRTDLAVVEERPYDDSRLRAKIFGRYSHAVCRVKSSENEESPKWQFTCPQSPAAPILDRSISC